MLNVQGLKVIDNKQQMDCRHLGAWLQRGQVLTHLITVTCPLLSATGVFKLAICTAHNVEPYPASLLTSLLQTSSLGPLTSTVHDPDGTNAASMQLAAPGSFGLEESG